MEKKRNGETGRSMGKNEMEEREMGKNGTGKEKEKEIGKESEMGKNGIGKNGSGSEMGEESEAAIEEGKMGKGEVLREPVPEWATSAAVAEMLGLKLRRVQSLTQEGVLKTERPPGGGRRLYRTRDVWTQYGAYIKDLGRHGGKKGEAADLAVQKLKAEVKLKESQGQLAAIKADIASGRYIEAEAAARELEEFMARFRSFALNIPSRVAGLLAGYTDAGTAKAIERVIRREVEGMLTLFVDAAVTASEEEKEHVRESGTES